jgi:hypothetical protein
MSISCPGTLSTGFNGEALCDQAWIVEPDVMGQLVLILENTFATPSAIDIQQAFMAGCSLPLIAYLVAYGYQTVMNFIK